MAVVRCADLYRLYRPCREATRWRQTGGRSQARSPQTAAPCPPAALVRSAGGGGRRRDHAGAPAPHQGAMAPWLICVISGVATAPSLELPPGPPDGGQVAADWWSLASSLPPDSRSLPTRCSRPIGRGRGRRRDHAGAPPHIKALRWEPYTVAECRASPEKALVVHGVRQH